MGIVICALFIAGSFVKVDSLESTIFPVCIVGLLLVVVVYSSVVAAKKIYKALKSSLYDGDELQKYEDEILMTVEQSQKMMLK